MKKFLAVLAITMSLAGAVLAQQRVAEQYTEISQAGTPDGHRTGLSSDDSAVAPAPIDVQDCKGNPVVVVAPRFSAAGATATVEVWLYHSNGAASPTYTLLGISAVQTATAGSLRRDAASGKYLVVQSLTFDTLGANAYDVRYRGISSGTVDSWSWTVGGGTTLAE